MPVLGRRLQVAFILDIISDLISDLLKDEKKKNTGR
jgi:hypothetical protein